MNILILLSLLLWQVPQPPSPPVSAAGQSQDDYSIGVADVLDVTVFNEPDASRAGVVVDTDVDPLKERARSDHLAGRAVRVARAHVLELLAADAQR